VPEEKPIGVDDLLLKVAAKLRSRAKGGPRPSSRSRERAKLINYDYVKHRLNAQTVASMMKQKEAQEQREALSKKNIGGLGLNKDK